MTHKKVDIVVAVRNEQENLPVFVRSVRSLDIPGGIELSFIFVEDGSTDRTCDVLVRLAGCSKDVQYYSLVKGYGQVAAIWYGLSRSSGDAVIMMDVDGQHPLELIPEMLSDFLAGVEIVQTCRRDRTRRTNFRKMGAKMFNGMVYILTGVDLSQQTVYYRLVSRAYKEKMLARPWVGRFLRINPREEDPKKVKMLYFDYVERDLGRSNYNLGRLLKLAAVAILSSMSVARFSLLSLIMFLFAASLFAARSALAGAIVLVAGSLLGFLYYRVRTFDVLDLLTVASHSEIVAPDGSSDCGNEASKQAGSES